MRTEFSFPHFTPPGCPRPGCPAYGRALPPSAFRLVTRYFTRGYPGGIPLYRCLEGGHSFSLRRFSPEYYLHKPHLTPWAIDVLSSCVSLRQGARHEGALSFSSLERRLRRFGLHAHRLLRRARREHPHRLAGTFELDEGESFERDRRAAPVTIPLLIHRASRFTLAAHVGTLPPRRRRRPGARESDPLDGRDLVSPGKRRRSESRKVVGRCLAALLACALPGAATLTTDRKAAYASALRRLDPAGALAHRTVLGRPAKKAGSALFAVNHLLAMARDGLSRLKRRTWCHSKSRLRLWWHLGIYLVWKNFVRRRTNKEKESAAQRAGMTGARWRLRDLVRWRLDLGEISFSPFRGVMRSPYPAW